MSYLWAQARLELKRVLDDIEEDEPKFPDELLVDGINRALEALSSHTAVASGTELDGDGSTTTFDIPDNCLEDLPFVYLWDEDQQVWWKPIAISPGMTAPDPTPQGTNDRRYYEWPKFVLNLLSAPSGTVTMYYFANWDPIIDEDSPIAVPVWAREAILMYAASYIIMQDAVSSADIRRWNNKEDSGTPEHNPLLRIRESFLRSYNMILQQHPVQEKVPPFDGWRQ